jgi:hypothetical protein
MHRIDKDGIGPVIGVTAVDSAGGLELRPALAAELPPGPPGLGQGGIFPEFVYPDAPKNGVSLGDLFNGKLANSEAYAKALVYSLIAGFAERFVPQHSGTNSPALDG